MPISSALGPPIGTSATARHNMVHSLTSRSQVRVLLGSPLFPEDKKSEWLLGHALFFLNSTNHLPEQSLEDSGGHDQDERLVAESRGANDHLFAVAHPYVAMNFGFGPRNRQRKSELAKLNFRRAGRR